MTPTPRQLQVLAAYIECGSREEAARRLGLDLATVKNYLTICRESFGARNTAQAFGIAVQRGLIDPAGLTFRNRAA